MSTSLLLGWTNIFPPVSGDPLVSYSLTGGRSFPAFKTLQLLQPDRRCFKTLSWGQTIFTSNQVKQLLNGRGHLLMSDQRILRYQVVFMENPSLTISPVRSLTQPSSCLTPEGSLCFHFCLENSDHWTKPQKGLSEDPLTNSAEIWYTDRGSFV